MSGPRIETQDGQTVLVCDVPREIAHERLPWAEMVRFAHALGYVAVSWSTVSKPHGKSGTIEFTARLARMGDA